MNWLRPLGRTGLTVSALGLGTVKLGRNSALRYRAAFELPDDRAARALLDTARELGINLLDTAPAYGRSEERLGGLLAGERGQWVLCSKVGEIFDGGHSRFDFSPEYTVSSIRESLRRLRTDYLDVALVHSNGDDLAIIERLGTLDALADLKRQGLVRAIGLSSKTLAGGLRAAQCCDVVMVTYNPCQRQEQEVLDACAARGTGALVKKPLASGHLPVGEEAAFLRDSMALVLGHPGVGAALVGTLSPEHLRQNIAAARSFLG